MMPKNDSQIIAEHSDQMALNNLCQTVRTAELVLIISISILPHSFHVYQFFLFFFVIFILIQAHHEMQSSVQQFQQQSQPSVVPAIQKSLLQKQPPQDTNGTCIVLKGIQGMNLTNKQMQLMYQRVKQHLIKKVYE